MNPTLTLTMLHPSSISWISFRIMEPSIQPMQHLLYIWFLPRIFKSASFGNTKSCRRCLEQQNNCHHEQTMCSAVKVSQEAQLRWMVLLSWQSCSARVKQRGYVFNKLLGAEHLLVAACAVYRSLKSMSGNTQPLRMTMSIVIRSLTTCLLHLWWVTMRMNSKTARKWNVTYQELLSTVQPS